MNLHLRKVALFLVNGVFWIVLARAWPEWVRWALGVPVAWVIGYCILKFDSLAQFKRCLRAGRFTRCRHERASVSEWTHSDGTPMVTIFCPDCRWRDQGPVIQ